MSGPELLERDTELEILGELVAEAAAGAGRLLLIEGPAGIGKSQLLAAARARAGDELRVLSARVGELEQDFPFGVVRQLLEAAALADPEALAGAAAPARSVFETPAAPGQEGGADTSFAVLHGLYWLALNLAEQRPLLLSIDDLHWCDRPSLRFLAYLVRRLEGVPILVAASVRSTEPGTDPALLAELTHDPATVAVRPGPLSLAAVDALVRARLGADADAAFRDACHRATGGNPLLLRQLLTALERDGVRPEAASVALVHEIGPRAASRSVLLRLARLPADAIPVARAVAMLGESAELPLVARLAGLDEARAADAIGELERAEILVPATPPDFVHPLVRAAVYQELSPAQRALEHGRAAELLTATGASTQRVAAQLLHTPPRGQAWVAERLLAAGAEARRRGAVDSAVTYLRRALREPPPEPLRPQVEFALGTAQVLIDGPAAIPHLRAAAENLEDPVTRVTAIGLLGRTLMFTGDVEAARVVVREAAAALPADAVDARRALEAVEHATTYFGAGAEEELDRLLPYRDGLSENGPGTKMLLSICAHDWGQRGGSAEQVATLALRALDGGELLAADGGMLGITAINLLVAGDRPEAAAAWEAARAQAHEKGSLLEVSGLNLWQGFANYRRGDLAEAETMLRRGFEEFDRWGYGAEALAYRGAFLALTLVERGDLAGARAVLDTTVAGHPRSEGDRFRLFAWAELHVAAGEPAEAVARTEQIAVHDTERSRPMTIPWLGTAALALHRLGRHEEAAERAAEQLHRARVTGVPWTLGRALRILGELEGDAAGLPRLREAVAVLESSPARLEHAKALAALGGALRRTREPAAAREPLRRALELASACAASGLAEQVRGELYATGARPRTDALQGVEALTPSERRVVDLAAGGRSNRDIAQALFVTPKTVEVHLTAAYRKLGIRSRRELGRALA